MGNIINQRDVYLLPVPIGNNIEPHPFIVLSSSESLACENTFIAVMVTSSDVHKDDYSFELSNEMFERNLAKENSHVRMHLITLCFNPEDLKSKKLNRMKERYFRELMKAIGELIFEYNFTPLT